MCSEVKCIQGDRTTGKRSFQLNRQENKNEFGIKELLHYCKRCLAAQCQSLPACVLFNYVLN